MKKLTSQSGFFNARLLAGSPFILMGILLAIAALGAGSAFDRNSGVTAGRNTHTTSGGGEKTLAPAAQMSAEELAVSLADTFPTRSTFIAKWNKVDGATGYRLDVSMDSSFVSCLEGYRDLDVGGALGTTVTGLKQGTTYYYRVRAYVSGSWAASNTTATTTVATAGLNIVPTFDTSITGNPSSVAIQASINRAIAILENLYRDVLTVPIRFRYSTVDADGSPLSGIARSNYGIHQFPWNTYLNALRADAKSANDSVANNYLPPSPPPGIFNLVVSSANGRSVGLNTPPTMCSDAGFSCAGPFYDGIVSLNAAEPIQFTRPASGSKYDAQMALEHEIDEVLGLGTFHDCSYCQNNSALRPADLYSWSAAGSRSNLTTGLRYFSINNGATRVVDFNQQSNGDRGDWAGTCPHPVPRPQDAFLCFGQSADVAATSAEGIHLDVIGFDLGGGGVTARDRYDFNGDGKPDYVLYNASTRRTAIWYLNNNTRLSTANGPTLVSGWRLVDVADFNRDGKPDYLLYNPTTHQSVIWYLNNSALISGVYGPTLPTGWELVLAGDFNADGKPDYVLYNASTLQTVIWYMNNNVFVNTVFGPTLASGYKVVSIADFNRDGKSDYLLFNASTHKSAIGYLNGATLTSNAFGPTITTGYGLVGAADFNRDGKPDYALFNPGTRNTAIWNLNNNVFSSGVYGPGIPAGWSLIRP